ncbi:MAG: 16S rRNA (cytosine(1402)-N(4))-methyltransferase RsmH, partial [Candidatus Poribacteria bacterium]
MPPQEPSHTPVMVDEVLQCLRPGSDRLYVDATVGLGGHSARILDAAGPGARLIGVDQDPIALDLAHERLKPYGAAVTLVQANFADLDAAFEAVNERDADGILMDIGMSSYQLDHSGRGFSFNRDEPLDMRMNPETELTARHVVNRYRVEELETVIREYGEERWARRIAQEVVKQRKENALATTAQLAALIQRVTPAAKRGRIHPATRTFQALRICVNDELGALRRGLDVALDRLRPDGTLCVIAFHSLEDRIVKRFMQARTGGGPR